MTSLEITGSETVMVAPTATCESELLKV